MSSSTTPPTQQPPQTTSALTEVLNNWKTAVLDDQEVPPTKSNEDLQKDAHTFFRYISSNTQIDIAGSGVVLETKSSHEEALALLIKNLGPAFTSSGTHPQRLRGLYVLLGAIDGCCHSTNMSNACLKSLGEFLLLQCGPIVDDEYEEDYDTMIRDVCVKALTALVETPTSASNEEDIANALEQRCHFAARGVERRCAAPDDMDQDAIDPYGGPRPNDIRGGLSMLPRSKRSLCFDLLRGAVTGNTKINAHIIESPNAEIVLKETTLLSKVQRHFVLFTEFSSRCIPGESDPRCLMQLLELLHSIQATFQDWFQTVELASNVFPHEDVFESVVPYYPIQFTPPPNNIHGITRQGLHSELAAVLTCTKMDKAARKYRKPTMLGCSAQLFMEQLLPMQPDEDLPPSSLEKLEALECLSTLLFPGKNGGESGLSSSDCKHLTISEVRSLSGALRATHDEASLGARKGGSQGEADKVLATSCRDLVLTVAVELENSGMSSLWKEFVSEPLDKDIRKLQLSPSYSKTAIAYEACLCASGGPKTLRVCLSKGLAPLLQFLKDKPDDSEDYLAAIHGLSAFFSSTKVALSKLHEYGVEITPHPLEPYSKKACALLLNVVDEESASYSLSTKAAATTALECLFAVASKSQLDSEDVVARICNFFEGLLSSVTSSERDESDEEFSISQSTLSRVLGELIGGTLDTEDTDQAAALNLDESILSLPQIWNFVESKIFPALKASAFAGSTDRKKERYDRKAMATACSLNIKLADSIVQAHLAAFYKALTESLTGPTTVSTLEALSYIIRQSEGDNVVRAFHEDETVDRILDALSNKLKDGTSARLRASIAQIALPATAEEQTSLMSKASDVQKLESSLVPAYNNSVPKERLSKLFKDVSQKIPPLSKADECDLFVRLPLLGAALQSASSSLLKEVVTKVGGDDENALVVELLKGLSEYAMSSEHLASARTAAALCVYGLVKGGFDKSAKCPARPLAEDAMNRLKSSSGDVGLTQNCLNYLSLLGQAAGIRGSSSSSTAGSITKFLVEVACEQKCSIPFLSEGLPLDLASSFVDPEEIVAVQLSAASAYGSMLMIDAIKPLMKQRLTHASLKFVKKTFELESNQAQHDEQVSAPSIGQLLVVCHVICSADLRKMDRATTHMIATVCIEGFSSDAFQVGKKMSNEAVKARTLVVCAALNLICTIPKVVNGFVLSMVAGLLRAYAVTDPDTEVGCKLIVLQSLEKLSSLDGAKATIVTVKPAVLAILAVAMNQKSGLLRSAAVD
ncbi:MAG: hypothetical protein SGILL_006374, partial [Bacillariaceae sp.]